MKYVGILSINLLIIFLEVLQIVIPEWVEQGLDDRNWKGGLLSRSNTFYVNISCQKKELKFCQGYMRLWKAGVIYLSLELLSAICVLVHVLNLLKLANDIKIKAAVLVALSLAGGFLHLAAYIAWSAIARLTFSGCSQTYRDDADASICGTGGPIIGIIIIFLLAIQSGYIIFLQYRLKKNLKEPVAQSEVPTRQEENPIKINSV
jgi:hypothetical protein